MISHFASLTFLKIKVTYVMYTILQLAFLIWRSFFISACIHPLFCVLSCESTMMYLLPVFLLFKNVAVNTLVDVS